MFEKEKKEINQKISKICQVNNLPDVPLEWRNIPFSGEWGIAAPLFPLASVESKQRKGIPVPQIAQEIAQLLADSLTLPSGFTRIQAVKGYLNLYFSNAEVTKKVVNQVIQLDMDYGNFQTKKEKVMVEYSQPNTHKPMHVGHLRNVILGGAVSNILESAGYEVIRANYLGDIGLHVIKWLCNYEKYHAGEIPGEDKTRWMGDLYAEADRRFHDDPDFEVEVRQYFSRWDRRDPEIMHLWEKTRQWSLDGFFQIYNLLGEKFDKLYFESEVEDPGKQFVDRLINMGLAQDDRPDGPVFVDIDKLLGKAEEYRVVVVLRSDGTSLYATKELPLALMKFEEFNLDRSIYVVDVRQSLHMKQIFKILELMQYPWSSKLIHLAYEVVNLPGNVTMSSREGTVVLLDDLIRECVARAIEIVNIKNPDLPEEQKQKIALAVSIGAIKYPMLSRENTKIVTFDWDSALDFNGQSAPYIQYAHVRAGSILRKAENIKNEEPVFSDFLEPSEINLIESFLRLPVEIERAAKDLKPSLIANYAYELAKSFNDFYNSCPVLSAEQEKRAYRIQFVKAAKICLAISLKLLGIIAPEVM